MEKLIFPRVFKKEPFTKLQESKDYISISIYQINKGNRISQELIQYHIRNYNRIQLEDFINSLDYINQNIRLILSNIEESNELTEEISIIFLEEIIIEIDKILQTKQPFNIRPLLSK